MTDWIFYTMWAVFGLMWLDLLIALFKSLVTKSFSLSIVLDYLKDVLYYVMPLMVVLNLMSMDSTGWFFLTFYFIGGLAVIWHYLVAIKNKWRA
jgi:hypothetical protein